MAITQEMKEQITGLYVGYFGRAPDPDGLTYWLHRLEDGMSLDAIAQSFAAQPEALDTYPYLDNPDLVPSTDFITRIYMNLFNRAPDAEGLEYWQGQLAAGYPISKFILAITNGAAAGSEDAAVVANKVEVGLDWAVSTAKVPGFEYDESAQTSAAGVLDGVTADDASVEAAKAETDAFIAGGGDAGDTEGGGTPGGGGTPVDVFTLTAGKDFADTSGSSYRNDGLIESGFVFTSDNETVSAITATLNATDVLVDGSATDEDELNVMASGNVGLTLAAATVANIENVNITAVNAAGTLGLASFTGVQSLAVAGSLSASAAINAFATSSVTSIDTSAATGFGFTVSDAAAKGVTVTTGGEDDTVTLGDGNVVTTGAGADAVTVADGDNTIDAGSGADNVTIGDGNNTVDLGNGANILTAGDGNSTVESGAGDDTIVVGNGDNIITAGDGADTITLGTGGNVVVIGAGDSGTTTATVDTIVGFTSGADQLSLGAAASFGDNYQRFGFSSGSVVSVEDAINREDTLDLFDGTIRYLLVEDTTNGYLLVDTDLDGTADYGVALTGGHAGNFDPSDIIA